MSDVYVKSYGTPPMNIKEILRYAQCSSEAYNVMPLISDCIEETRNIFSYRVCYSIFDKKNINSSDLGKNLQGCKRIIIFAATVGLGLDRLIMKYTKTSPSKAIILQAIGAERIESLCDMFCDDISRELKVKLNPRFSPGYGDFSLDAQKEIFRVLDCSRKIGLTLNESLLMSPTKSVTAIIGIKDEY